MATESQTLSPKAKENLRKNAELRQKGSKFIKLEPGEKRIFQFDAEKIEPREDEFNGKKTPRFYYVVTEPNNGIDQEERYLPVGKQTSESIDSYLAEGHSLLKIQRFGLGKDTRYHVTPA
jgi:hypothetical protein